MMISTMGGRSSAADAGITLLGLPGNLFGCFERVPEMRASLRRGADLRYHHVEGDSPTRSVSPPKLPISSLLPPEPVSTRLPSSTTERAKRLPPQRNGLRSAACPGDEQQQKKRSSSDDGTHGNGFPGVSGRSLDSASGGFCPQPVRKGVQFGDDRSVAY